MMEKLAQGVEGGGACPPPFTIYTITDKVEVYTPAERPTSTPPYMYSVAPAEGM